MTLFSHSTLLTLSLGFLVACAQVGVPIENHSDTGYLDQVLEVPPKKIRAELETYLRARNLLEAIHEDKQGNYYLHQNWVQSPSLRYYELDFDRRTRHLSEWKALWYVEPSTTTTGGTSLRLAILELLYLGDPTDRVRAPKEPDGNWVETDMDKERAKLLYEDFASWRKTGQLSKSPAYLKTEELSFVPKFRVEFKEFKNFAVSPWWIP